MGILKFLWPVLIFNLSVYAMDDVTEQVKSLKPLHMEVDQKKDTRVLYFWASWCPDCRDKLDGKIQKLENDNIEIMTINVDRKAKKGVKFVEETGLKLPVLRDEEKIVRKHFKVFSVPSWAVLKRDSNKKWNLIKVSGGSDLEAIKENL